MTVEEVIKGAIEYEEKVRNVYEGAIVITKDKTGKKILRTLAKEEQHHVDFLYSKLKEWEDTGHISEETIKSTVPPRDQIKKGIASLKKRVSEDDFKEELKLLRKALELEIETTLFYQKMVSELPSDVQPLFSKFIEIEKGHEMIVQTEIDTLTGLGFWFDYMEFDLESA